jgi:hypothetical protein
MIHIQLLLRYITSLNTGLHDKQLQRGSVPGFHDQVSDCRSKPFVNAENCAKFDYHFYLDRELDTTHVEEQLERSFVPTVSA